jgi:GWxTD domain-containing protein
MMLLSPLVLALGALSSAPVQQSAPQLAVKAVRFFAPDSARTSVVAFLQVPYILAEPTPAGDRIVWQTTLEVFDGAGTRLYAEPWWSSAPASFRIPEAYGMETLKLGQMSTGTFRIKVTVMDSVTGRSTSAETVVEGFTDHPAVSDLLLASQMRITSPGDTVSMPGEFSRGNVRFVTSPVLTLDALEPNLAFLLEAYSDVETSATTRLEVRSAADGTIIYRLPPVDQTIPAGGGVIRAQIPLEGLPEGSYDLVANVTLGERQVERSDRFGIGSLEVAMARSIAARNAARGLDEAYFASLSEDELDRAQEALELIAKSSELAVYKADGDGALTVNAKRQFLIQFWAERDTDKATAANEYRMAFYDLIERADQLFGEDGRNVRPGWKTDRGRVYVKYGQPDERNPFPSGDRAPPFEIWRYTQGRLRWYIFVDRNNFGNFSLIKTNDQFESSAPNWCEVLTPQVVRNTIEPFLGQQFLQTTSSDPNNPNGGINTISCT